jgi:maltose alpha-D-glucosyltransferase/alpha-amylase
MSIDDLWYKNAVIYCLDVEKYMDANGDGVGDFEGLSRRLDYLQGLGVTCLWLQPFYPSPNRDNGYDVADYYGVHPKHGTPGEFVDFMNHAESLGLRVIVDLVVNHTSIDHPWFQSARSDPASPFRDWYVWSKERPADHDQGMVFPGTQETTWTFDEAAKEYYFHRFYEFQADLDTHREAVRREIERIMGYWLQLGVSGFRMDAVPFLIERKGAGVDHAQDFELLHQMRHFLQWRAGDAILLAEANVPPDESVNYFGDRGDRLQCMLNFPVNQRLFYALASGDTGPLAGAIEQTAGRPESAQWVQFLRSHDELDLGRLSDEQREQTFAAFGPEEHMQLYHRGIRRRLAPMLGNDRRRLELAFSLLFSLPGTPMMQYGDEIGMGDNLALPERECARTPMQWTGERHGGFSNTDGEIVRPAIDDEVYGYRRVNVAEQRREPNSLLNWTERRIRMRKECPEISWGAVRVLPTGDPAVLALRYDYRGTSLITLHNFADAPRRVHLRLDVKGRNRLVNVFEEEHSDADESGTHHVALRPYGYQWLRVGAVDNALVRRDG